MCSQWRTLCYACKATLAFLLLRGHAVVDVAQDDIIGSLLGHCWVIDWLVPNWVIGGTLGRSVVMPRKTVHSVLADECSLRRAHERQKRPTAAGFEPARVTPIDFESIALTARPSCLDNPPLSPTHTPALAHSIAHCKQSTRTQHLPAPHTPCTSSRRGCYTTQDAIHTVVCL